MTRGVMRSLGSASILIIAWLYIASCIALAPGEEARRTATPPLTSIPRITSVPSPVPSALPATPYGQAAATGEAPPLCVRPIPDLSQPIALPDPTSLRWETLAIQDKSVRQLAGFKYPIFPILPSPDGHWLEVMLELHPTAIRAASILVDTRDDAHRWLNIEDGFYSDYYFTPDYSPPSPWLQDGRFLWAVGGQIYLGDTANPRLLTSPQPIQDIRYAAHGIAFARTEAGDLWRVNLDTAQWEKVTTPRPPLVGTLGGSFHLAWDGSYGIAFQENGQMWRIPAKIGAVAEPLHDVKVTIVGRGGGSAPTAELAGSPYWVIGLPVQNDYGWAEGFMVDLRNGHVVSAGDFGQSEAYYPYDYTISPGGHWLAATLRRKGEPIGGRDDPKLELYLTPSNNLRAGRLLKAVSVAGWHTDPLAVVLRDNLRGTLQLLPLPLAAPSSAVLLPNARLPIATLPNAVLAVDERAPARVMQLGLDGHLAAQLDLSGQYDEIQAMLGSGDRVFLGVKGGAPQDERACNYSLVEWLVGR